MACGNNKITRAYLSSPPSNVAAHLGQITTQAPSTASRREQLAAYAGHVARNERRLGEFILPTGQDQKLASSRDRKRYEGIHVHVVNPDGDFSTWQIQGTDRVNKTGWYDHSGHFENVLLFHNPSRERVEQEKARMLSVLNARSSGWRGR